MANLSRRDLIRLLVSAPPALSLASLGSLGTFASVASLTTLTGCGAPGPRPIRIGEEECAHCRMRISDDRFPAQAANDRGRRWVFDAIECMAAFLIAEAARADAELPEGRIAGLWVTDFGAPGAWLDAHEAYFLRSSALRSPMGFGLSAWPDRDDARAALDRHDGEILRWPAVRRLVAGEHDGDRPEGHAGDQAGGHDAD